jgi:hypothetical protein
MKLISILMLAGSLIGISAQERESAVVSFLVGKVNIKSTADNKWKPLKKEDAVNSGDSIMTGNGSVATITYKGSEFKISANSTIVVNSLYSKDKDGSVEVKNGGAWFNIKDLGPKKFTASTPTSTAGVRGTAFGALYDDKTKVARPFKIICRRYSKQRF